MLSKFDAIVTSGEPDVYQREIWLLGLSDFKRLGETFRQVEDVISCKRGNGQYPMMRILEMHGARRRETISRGENHSAYRHVGETLVAKAERSCKMLELREGEALSFAYGFVPKGTPRW